MDVPINHLFNEPYKTAVTMHRGHFNQVVFAVKILWGHSHLVWLVLGDSILTCTCFCNFAYFVTFLNSILEIQFRKVTYPAQKKLCK